MTKIIFSVIIIGSLFFSSCKENEDSQLPQPTSNTPYQVDTIQLKSGGGGDDDDPIVMEFTVDQTGNPISNSTVTFRNSSDTLTGTTNASGYVLFKVAQGTWVVEAIHPLHTFLPKNLNVISSMTDSTWTN